MSMATHSPFAPRWIGPYLAVDRIAVGGMAEILLAMDGSTATPDPEQDDLLILKRLLPHLAEDVHRMMFLSEAMIGKALQHPNVVSVFDVDGRAEPPFMVMEYIQGATVRDLSRAAARAGQPLPMPVAVDLICQACDGVHAAHQLRDELGRPMFVVHRDLSPHNLALSPAGDVVVLDFGIAKSARDGDVTETGVLKGKLRYMSPEQCNQEAVDHRSDIFTLGIVLWELVAGERLFDGRTELQTLQAVSSATVRRVEELRPEVPPDLATAIHQALLPDPSSRFDSAARFAEVLRGAIFPERARSAAAYRELLGELDEERLKRDAAARRRIEAFFDAAPTEEVPAALDPAQRIPAVRTPRSTHRPSPSRPRQSPPAPPSRARALVGGVGVIGLLLVASWLAYLPRAPTGPPLRIAITPTLDESTIREDFSPLLQHLERQLDRPVELSLGRDYGHTASLLRSGEVPFAMFTPYLLARHLEDDSLQPIAVKVVDGGNGSDGVLLVREGSQLDEIADLRGRTICLVDPDSTSGYALPRRTLTRHGLNPSEDVVVRLTGSHSQSMRDLHAGRCDAAGTYSTVYIASDQAGPPAASFRVLAITGRIPHDTLVAGPAASPRSIEAMQRTVISYAPEEGRPDGQVERISGFAPVDEEVLHQLEELRELAE